MYWESCKLLTMMMMLGMLATSRAEAVADQELAGDVEEVAGHHQQMLRRAGARAGAGPGAGLVEAYGEFSGRRESATLVSSVARTPWIARPRSSIAAGGLGTRTTIFRPILTS